MVDLPLLEPLELTERADAADNRRRIIAAASELFADRGAACVSMQDVAQAAGVGMGTMYRRFSDRAGLTFALLGERHRQVQEEILHGPPPLGPGAPPRERLHAFGRARLELLERDVDLLVTIGPVSSALSGPDIAYRMHIGVLLREAGVRADVEYAMATLTIAFDARLHAHLRRDNGWSLERIQDGWCALADAWLGAH